MVGDPWIGGVASQVRDGPECTWAPPNVHSCCQRSGLRAHRHVAPIRLDGCPTAERAVAPSPESPRRAPLLKTCISGSLPMLPRIPEQSLTNRGLHVARASSSTTRRKCQLRPSRARTTRRRQTSNYRAPTARGGARDAGGMEPGRWARGSQRIRGGWTRRSSCCGRGWPPCYRSTTTCPGLDRPTVLAARMQRRTPASAKCEVCSRAPSVWTMQPLSPRHQGKCPPLCSCLAGVASCDVASNPPETAYAGLLQRGIGGLVASRHSPRSLRWVPAVVSPVHPASPTGRRHDSYATL